jgi:hypothetical protein
LAGSSREVQKDFRGLDESGYDNTLGIGKGISFDKSKTPIIKVEESLELGADSGLKKCFEHPPFIAVFTGHHLGDQKVCISAILTRV